MIYKYCCSTYSIYNNNDLMAMCVDVITLVFFLIIKKVLLGITTLITATATTSTISIINFNYLFYCLLSFPITTAAIVTTLTAIPTTTTGFLPFQEKHITNKQHLWSRTCPIF